MVTESQIKEWKEKYTFVYKVVYDKDVYFYHTLDRDSYQDISRLQVENPGTFDYEYEVCKVCLLGDLDVEALKKKSGVISALAEQIMFKSGFQSVESEEL